MSTHILPHALRVPSIKKLAGKRIVLASNSPRRKEIFHTILGLAPDIVPSTFSEDLPVGSFEDVHEYPVATATHKAVEVYERLVVEQPDDAPDLVIAADTVVLSHAQPSTSQTSYTVLTDTRPELLEKPVSKEDHLRMLLDLNGAVCEVVTGVTVGKLAVIVAHSGQEKGVYPILSAPGYSMKSIDERTLVHFADNPRHIIEQYVESGEGLDRAGGFAIQGLGGVLIRKIEGDYQNVVGFPAASFFRLLDLMVEEEPDFLDI